jgi:hypothetical protein
MKSLEGFKEGWAGPAMEFKPDVRWWLAEGFHTDETLKNDIKMIYEAGFGAAEFLAMDEHGADHAKYGWGSEEWVHDTHTVIRETTERNMGSSFTSGTNWSNANLITINPDDRAASKELDYTVESLKAGQSRSGPLQKADIRMPNVKVQELIAVVAAKKTGEKNGRILLDKASLVALTDKVSDGSLDWKAPDSGDWELFAFWLHGTGQTATPSVSVSYTVNYIDRYGVDALKEYWDKVVLTPELRSYISKNPRIQMYMDSLELSTYGKGGQFWGYHFMDEFKKRRGYDLTPYLPFAVKKGAFFGGMGEYEYRYESGGPDDDAVFVKKTRNDLYQTMTDLYIDSMLKPMQEWLHSVGVTLRAEISYGMPFEISLPGKYVDGIETESLEFASQIEPYRNLAGPAHLFNKLYSSETGATMLNYQMGLDFYTQIIYTQFAAGVARTVLHGYSSIAGSESATYWPGHEGMWPIFSERFGCRQPAWQHYNGWTAMIARYQYALRRGKPRVDLGILRLDYTFNNFYGIDPDSEPGANEKVMYESRLMRGGRGVFWRDMGLQYAGYTWDYFAPQILEDTDIIFAEGVIAPGGPGYKALIIYQEALPLSSAKRILSWAEKGLPVILVNGATERIRPVFSKTHKKAANITPFNGEKDCELKAVIDELKKLPNVKELDNQAETVDCLKSMGIIPRASFAEPNDSILTAAREDGDLRFVFAYNFMYTKKQGREFSLVIEGSGKPWLADPWTGETREIGCYARLENSTGVTLSLMPGEACLVVLDTGAPEENHAVEIKAASRGRFAASVIRKDGKWTLKSFSPSDSAVKMSGGAEVKAPAAGVEPLSLDTWDLVVEDWNEGEKKTIVEDRGLGLVTKEVYYETKKTPIKAGSTALKPWREIPAVGKEVSGVGYYTAKFAAPAGWNPGTMGACLAIESTNGNTAAVYVNGKKAPPYDFNAKTVDISGLVAAGENTLTVEVSSTLNNRLKARNYHDIIKKTMENMAKEFAAAADGPPDPGAAPPFPGEIQPDWQDYGMTGKTELHFYRLSPLD